MSENKRYYWLRLYDDFFTSKRIKKLRALAGGDTYTIIYLKMQLKAIKDDGYLYFDSIMTDFAEELALDIDESPDDVRVTIQYLMSVGLLECSEDGEQYFLTYMPNLIGSETASTQRSRDCRKRKKEQEALQCNADATQVQHHCNVEKEIEKEKDKEIEKENRREERHKHGEYGHVMLTDKQYQKLVEDYGEDSTKQAIKKVDEYCQQYGKSYKDYNLTLRKWGFDGIKTQKDSRTGNDLDEWAARKEREKK